MRIQKVFGVMGFIAVAVLSVCIVFASSAAAKPGDFAIKVMTRNMDAGTDFNLFGTHGFEEAVGLTLEEAISSRIPKRAARVAIEIAKTRPDLVALQEVTTWKIESGRRTIVLDQLELLMDALRAAGVHYRVAAVQDLTEIEIPDIATYSDHNAILVRSDRLLNVVGSETHIFDNLMPFPTPGGDIPVVTGWMAVDIKIHKAHFKFVNTHLSSAIASIPETAQLQLSQAAQLVDDLQATELPIILAGDFNSDAEPTHNYPADATESYGYIAWSGYVDAWEKLRPADFGYTWPLFGEDQMSGHDVSSFQERIDLIFSNKLEAVSIEKIGADPVRGIYASDHAGVVAEFELENHPSCHTRR
jgi:endonuclease/exonuclease/phosphatase family metal-dependent hydrolase